MASSTPVPIPVNVDPEKLTRILTDAGWRVVGGRTGIYTRVAPPVNGNFDARAASLLIPLNSGAPDFGDTMKSTLLQLSENWDLWSRSIYPRLAADAVDEFRFRKESAAPSGLIPWRSGEKLVESARRTLLAGAKAFIGPGRHFVNRNGRFAGRYLDQVLMGQTAPGSYIVTAYAPPSGAVTLKSGSDSVAPIPEIGAASVRSVSEAVVRAVEATAEALQHYKATGSLSGFEDGVARGVSYEMTSAILGMAVNSDESNIDVEWDAGSPQVVGLESSFVFRSDDVDPLLRATSKLAEDNSSQIVTVMGRVHLLAKKQAGSPGVFGVDSLQPDGPRKVRVRLADEDDYHEAVRAHEEELALQVTGSLEKEGNLSWLYNASVVQTLEHVENYIIKRGRGNGVRGQMDLFTES